MPADLDQPPPSATLSNRHLRATIYLPDPDRGFYRSTRFDWSGMAAPVEAGSHRYYDPWFTRSEPGVHDFIYRDDDIVAGAQSSAIGLAEEFPQPLGFDAARIGGSFVKVGVGVLRRTTGDPYSAFRRYDLVNPGVWASEVTTDAVASVQTVDAGEIGYVYWKTVSLVPGEPELLIEHALRNTGRLPIATTQYGHNFLTMDAEPTGPNVRISVPFAIRTSQPPDASPVTIRGGDVAFTRTLLGRDRVAFPVEGFSDAVEDYDVVVENVVTGARVRVTADRPMVRAYLWSIRSVVSFEPFVDVTTAPGATTTWTYRYRYGR